MKFCIKYEETIQGLGQSQKKLPRIGCQKIRDILEDCTKQLHPAAREDRNTGDGISSDAYAQHSSDVCEGIFFPLLLNEMSAVVGFFNERAQRLLRRAPGCFKCFSWFGDHRLVKGDHDDVELIQESEILIAYACMNAIAMSRLLKKYDKIHYSKQGQAFKSRAVSMQIEILQSPWLYELMAFYINKKESKANPGKTPVLLEGCSLVFDNGKPSLSFEIIDIVKLNIEIELTCSICLETLFDPISLGCGHRFCYMCACKAASVSVVDGLKAASHHKKCPICREAGVYESAMKLEQLHILLKRSCPESWKERRKAEIAERLQLAKQHWQSLEAKFLGI